MGKKFFFCFFQTAETGELTGEPGIGVKGSGANSYPRARAHLYRQEHYWEKSNYSPQDEFTWHMTAQ